MPAADSNTVLVVDDTPANLGVLVPTLEEAGFDVLDVRLLLRRQTVQSSGA